MSASADKLNELPFSPNKQKALLGWLMTNEQFFLHAKDVIKPEWFVDSNVGRIWKNECKFYAEKKRKPSVPEIKEVPDILAEDPKTASGLVLTINTSLHETQFFGLDTIIPEITEWMHTRIYHEAVVKSSVLFNSGRFQDAFRIMKEASKSIDEVKFESDNELNFANTATILDATKGELNNALTFGLKTLDKLLTPHASDGALLRGDMTLLIASTNSGKTSTMVTVTRANILKGKDVLFLTHEGRPEDLLEKFWCCFMKITKQQLYAGYTNEIFQKRMKYVLDNYITPHLVYIPMNKPGLTVEEVETMIRRKQEERIAKTGKGFDLVVDDYPAKLTTALAKNGALHRRHADEYVYNYFVQLALEYKFHALLAIQTNRTGSKVNKGQAEGDRLLDMEDVAEAWGPNTIATSVITINRDAYAEANDRITFKICKSRSGEKGFAIVAKNDFRRCISHSNDFPSTWYRGDTAMSQHVDDLLVQYPDQEVPEHEVMKTFRKDEGK